MMHYGKLLALAGLVGIVSAEAGGSAYFYRRTMMRYNAKTERTMKMSGVDWEQYFSKMKECREWMMEQPHEDVWIRSEDSLKLHGTYFRGAGNVEEKKYKKENKFNIKNGYYPQNIRYHPFLHISVYLILH